jgi:pyruvate formate lyase activating enzyme
MSLDNAQNKKIEGMVIEIQRWSVSDGPGARTVVFFKGCPLTCPWCANPESQDRRPQIGIFPSRCVACLACVRECPENVAIPAKAGAFSGDGCTQCGQCIPTCHSNARSWMGEKMTVDQIIQTIKKDMVFYRHSFGGVTFSGGEPLIQADFLKAVITECQQLGIHTAVETCGAFNWEAAKEAIRLLDFVMFDLKHMDDDQHKRLTGSSNAIVLANAKNIAALGIPMVIRIPVIPSINDSPQNIRATAEFVRKALPGAMGIELLPYHKLGLIKYQALGMEYQLDDVAPPDDAHMAKLRRLVAAAGVPCITVDDGYDTPANSPKLKVVS